MAKGTRAKSDASLRRQRDDLIKKGVKYCFSSFVDVHGIPKGKTVPVHHFERMMRGSELFTGAALDGLGQGPSDDELREALVGNLCRCTGYVQIVDAIREASGQLSREGPAEAPGEET